MANMSVVLSRTLMAQAYGSGKAFPGQGSVPMLKMFVETINHSFFLLGPYSLRLLPSGDLPRLVKPALCATLHTNLPLHSAVDRKCASLIQMHKL